MVMLNNERLKKIRKESGFNQSEVAAKLNIKRETYTRYETGTIQPPSDMILAIAKFYEVSADWLLNNTDDPTPPNKKNSIPPEKMKLLNNIGYAYFGGENKELDEDDVDTILEIVTATRKAHEKREKK